MDKYLTTDSIDISESAEYPHLKLEHVLQRFRDVWIVGPEYPYLSIDANRVRQHVDELQEFAVFSSSILFQNISREEFGQRLITSLVGPGLTAGVKPGGNMLVEGRANPQAHGLFGFNPLLLIGTHPFAASGTRYIYVTPDVIYQRSFGELVVVNGRSRSKSPHADFDPLADLLNLLWDRYLAHRNIPNMSQSELSDILDKLFVENGKVLAVATEHHHAMAPSDRPYYDYPAPVLTKYGRLTHGMNGSPQIEVSFSLLHYEAALLEFNKLKEAAATNNQDAAFRHGVYCIVAAAACVEAISNSLVFQATSQHPNHRDRRNPIQKINDSANLLSQGSGGSFIPLASDTPTYAALDALRIARNEFMHAKERESDVDPASGKSSVAASVDEASCRRYLRSLREAVAEIYKHLPNAIPPIVTKTNVTWLQNMEVP